MNVHNLHTKRQTQPETIPGWIWYCLALFFLLTMTLIVLGSFWLTKDTVDRHNLKPAPQSRTGETIILTDHTTQYAFAIERT